MRKIIGLTTALVILVLCWGNLTIQTDEKTETASPYSINLRDNYLKPTLKIADLEDYYATWYGSGFYDVEAYTKLKWDSESTSGLGLDFRYNVSPNVAVVFSYDTFKDMQGTIVGVGDSFFLGATDVEADVITIKDIKLLTLGVNYLFLPDKPVKAYVGAGIQKFSYKVTDEGAYISFDDITGVIFYGEAWAYSKSVSEMNPTFWAGADFYVADNFYLTFQAKYLNLTSKPDFGGDKVKIEFKGLDLTFGAGLSF